MANLSENKLKVTKLFGGAHSKGCLDAKVGMVTHQGTITQIKDSGRYIVAVSGAGVGMPTDFYPHDLMVTEAEASGNWAWPTGVGSVQYTRGNIWPNGVDDCAESGMYYSKGGTTQEFSR